MSGIVIILWVKAASALPPRTMFSWPMKLFQRHKDARREGRTLPTEVSHFHPGISTFTSRKEKSYGRYNKYSSAEEQRAVDQEQKTQALDSQPRPLRSTSYLRKFCSIFSNENYRQTNNYSSTSGRPGWSSGMVVGSGGSMRPRSCC